MVKTKNFQRLTFTIEAYRIVKCIVQSCVMNVLSQSTVVAIVLTPIERSVGGKMVLMGKAYRLLNV